MSNNQKKQSLLGKTPQRRKPTTASKKKGTSQLPSSIQSVDEQQITIGANNKKTKAKLIITGVILLIAVSVPKPQLITYEKLGLVTQSVYWPGMFGYGATLFDSSLQPQADLTRNSLYLCRNMKQPDSCQKYRITENAGFFAALKKLMMD
ncbi:hypothetical protein AMS58_11225 [Pseudoalteromonas porphyrae]|uniref:hypothetical protein n=1 Tax=Pseudoalteromonas TaxID=53246 RepID=UPI0006BB1C75|nr:MULTISPECIES: hypothetical protein [Pseudoalteromonas]KPH94564.1 hypothetical protein AMS58_11225 [Pseudoalteromonas porphyrae]NMR27917.1 hypothetical protein [Pseudoalteromonas sp. NEC-BIFX-2020_015]NNG43895.1 hypothetical protein [Pseudoalteromonas sp. NEC-BIFX-2020_002]